MKEYIDNLDELIIFLRMSGVDYLRHGDFEISLHGEDSMGCDCESQDDALPMTAPKSDPSAN